MTKPSWMNKEVFGWAMFDFANQAFTLVILTTMYQIYFVNHVVMDNESLGRQLWSTSNIIGQSIIIAISPVIGALADFSGAKKKLLIVTYVGCVVMTAMLGLITPGAVAWGMILFITGYLFYATGENFMASFLPELTTHRNMGKVSAFGFTLGYTGGLLCLLGSAQVAKLGNTEVAGFRLITQWAAVFFLFAALPTMLFLRERKKPEPMPRGYNIMTIGFHRVATTLRSLAHYRHLFLFLAIMTFYLAGMQIVIFFGGTMARELFDLSMTELGFYITMATVTAIIGAFATALYQDRIGTRNTILISLILWTVIMLAAVFIREEWKDVHIIKILFWLVGAAVGFGMGMLGTSSRAMVGLFSPPHKAAEFFGFYGLSHKAAAILGLSLNILAERIFANDYNLVVASSGIFFLGGIFLMLTVSEKDGRIAAIRSERKYHRELKLSVPPSL